MSDRYASPNTERSRGNRRPEGPGEQRKRRKPSTSDVNIGSQNREAANASVVTGAGRSVGNINRGAGGNSTSDKTGTPPDATNTTTTAPGINIPMSGTSNTAFGKQYDFNASGADIWNNPDSLAQDWLSFNGYNPMYNNGLTNKLKDYASRLDTLYLLLGGGSQSIPGFVDYVDSMMNSAMNPGGGYYSPQDIAKSLGIGQGQNTDFLQQMFNNPAASARQNADAYLSYFGNAMNGILPPPVLNALLGVASAGTDGMVANANKNAQQDPIWQQTAGILGGYFGV